MQKAIPEKIQNRLFDKDFLHRNFFTTAAFQNIGYFCNFEIHNACDNNSDETLF